MNDYYVYALMDPRKPRDKKWLGKTFKFLPRYIGKGRGPRANVSAFKEHNWLDSSKCQWIRRLQKEGLEPLLVYLKKDLEQDEAFALERKFISAIGLKKSKHGPLFNQSKGGEGGNRVTPEVIAAYKKALKNRGKELVLTGTYRNPQEYVDHRCPEHGTVSTAPVHVLKRLAKELPLCPRCGEEKRGPQMRKHRLSTGVESYRELLAKVNSNKYKLVGDYTGATKLTTHWCKLHGEFQITPASVRQKLTQGNTPCGSCNWAAKGKRHSTFMKEYHATK